MLSRRLLPNYISALDYINALDINALDERRSKPIEQLLKSMQDPEKRRQIQSGAMQVLLHEAEAIRQTAELLQTEEGEQMFCTAAEMILAAQGSLIVTGMGKAGLIGQKLTATFASTGTPAHFIHPGEAIHGDLGRLKASDVVLALSNSGETEELTRILPLIRSHTAGLIAICGRANSSLAMAADSVLQISSGSEACRLNLAPSASTAAMLALGDALALGVSDLRGFSEDNFAAFHPGGALGLKLMAVEQAMRPLDQCRVGAETLSVRESFSIKQPTRRSGAIMLLDRGGVLTGIFTDSDLAKLLQSRDGDALDRPISEVMTRRFSAIAVGGRVQDAIAVLSSRKISELPVVDDQNKPLGLIDITDVMQLMSSQPNQNGPSTPPPTRTDAGKELPGTIRLFR